LDAIEETFCTVTKCWKLYRTAEYTVNKLRSIHGLKSKAQNGCCRKLATESSASAGKSKDILGLDPKGFPDLEEAAIQEVGNSHDAVLAMKNFQWVSLLSEAQDEEKSDSSGGLQLPLN
jgi:hypothetical protein